MIPGGSKQKGKYRNVMCVMKKDSISEATELFAGKAKGHLCVSS